MSNQTARHTFTEVPRTDVFENANDYLLLLDLPGVSVKDLSIQLHQQHLTIEGRRDDQYRYKRSFEMPALIVTDKIDAVLKNGVLEVRIPKAEEAKPRTIAVKSPN